MSNLLWVGDAVAPTGFGRVSEAVLQQLRWSPLYNTRGWNIAQLGINYLGDPHPLPWRLYPASVGGGNAYGLDRLPVVYAKEQPNVVCCLHDPWIVAQYLQVLPGDANVVAYIPIDAANQWAAPHLNRLAMAVAYTAYGAQQLRLGGYTGPLTVIPHGIDTRTFYPEDRDAARQALGLDKHGVTSETYIVGNVNRNQIRKRLDLTIAYFAHWWNVIGQPPNVRLLLHCALDDFMGWDLVGLAKFFGIDDVMLFTGSQTLAGASTHDRLRQVYNACDLGISTTLGEGWGLTTMEFMACAKPVLVPRSAALAEWAAGAAQFIDCPTPFVQAGTGVNTIGAEPDRDSFVHGMNLFYNDPDLRKEYGSLALARVQEPRFKWDVIGKQFHDVFRGVIA